MGFAVATIAVIAAVGGFVLGYVGRRASPNLEGLAAQINARLPQTQCAQCGYPGCGPYAKAIAQGKVGIDRCPPGGEDTRRSLAALLGEENVPLASDLNAAPTDVVVRIGRGALYWLRAVRASLPGGRHRRRAAAPARRCDVALHGDASCVCRPVLWTASTSYRHRSDEPGQPGIVRQASRWTTSSSVEAALDRNAYPSHQRRTVGATCCYASIRVLRAFPSWRSASA